MGKPNKRLSLEERIAASTMPIPEAGCHLWIGPLDTSGYGQTKVGSKHMKAHRLAYEMKNGPIPEGMHVCHHCDTPSCINPDHLFLGTHSDNMRDKKNKGRAGSKHKGSASNLSKLTEDIVRNIKLDPRSNQAIAKEFGVTDVCVWQIRTGKSWAHVRAEACNG